MEETRTESEGSSSSSRDSSSSEEDAGGSDEQYDALIARIRDILSEHSDNYYNRRKESIRAKAEYYTDLADRLDETIAELALV
jgi:hypothetical protein